MTDGVLNVVPKSDFRRKLGVISSRPGTGKAKTAACCVFGGQRNCAALRSPFRRSAEEHVTGDWAAVAQAINQRMAELDLSQRELTDRSGVSKAIVGELQNNTAQRKRSRRTLEALSVALDWHPGHLSAVLAGHLPPRPGEPTPRSHDDIPGRLAVVEHQLREIRQQLDGLNAIGDQVRQLSENVAKMLAYVEADINRPKR
jgi:DNA-binding Xre family transcriptional regulator